MSDSERRRFPRIAGIGSLVKFKFANGDEGEGQLADISLGGLSMEFARPNVKADQEIEVSLLAADHAPLGLKAVVIRVVDERVAVKFTDVGVASQQRLADTAAEFRADT